MTKNAIILAAANYPATFRKALSSVLDDECEYDHTGLTIRWETTPGDAGGATFAGLTVRDDEVPSDPSPQYIADTYLDRYWKPFSSLPAPVSQLCFSMGVNFGIRTAVRLLQLACNDYGAHLTVDGEIGDNTNSAAWQCPDSDGLAMAFLAKCRARYNAIVSSKPDQQKFLNGWMARVDHLQREFITA
jgi:hypothetical protein